MVIVFPRGVAGAVAVGRCVVVCGDAVVRVGDGVRAAGVVGAGVAVGVLGVTVADVVAGRGTSLRTTL
jgi:hypothetical protein